MSKMTVRKASNRLALLLERKPEINQPGRLVNHLMDEMRLSNSERRNSGPIIETALDRLEERGVVILGKSGDNVYNSVLLVKNQAERRREAAEKEQQRAKAQPARLRIGRHGQEDIGKARRAGHRQRNRKKDQPAARHRNECMR